MSAGRSALITGASSGIGRATALHLARSGFSVYAGVRKSEDADSIAQEADGVGPLQPLILDVTDGAAIAAAAERIGVETGSAGLTALVNNAGIAHAGPLETYPLDDIRHQLEVNLIGQIAVTQAMLPALREASGRIVNVTSIGGRVATPFFGPYVASKFALEAVSDCLRTELRPWGIKTIAVEPGSVATEIWDSGATIAQDVRSRMPEGAEELYSEAIDQTARISAETGARGIPAEEVAQVIHKALTVRWPKARYLVGKDAKGMVAAAGLLPDRLWDRLVASQLKLP